VEPGKIPWCLAPNSKHRAQVVLAGAVSVERALDILGAEARANKIDAGLLQVFIESGAYRSGI
jgi:hypothetical protein